MPYLSRSLQMFAGFTSHRNCSLATITSTSTSYSSTALWVQTAVQCSSLLFLHFRAVCTSLVQSLQVGMKKRIQDFIAVYQLKNCESTATSYKTFLANLVASKNYPDFCLLIINNMQTISLLSPLVAGCSVDKDEPSHSLPNDHIYSGEVCLHHMSPSPSLSIHAPAISGRSGHHLTVTWCHMLSIRWPLCCWETL